MKLLRTFSNLLAPKKSEFIKRLIAKRRACAQNSLLAGMASLGTTQYKLRELGLEATEYAVSPEATIVNALEQYWQPHIAAHFTNQSMFGGYRPSRGATEAETYALAKKRANQLAGLIEYRLTGNRDAPSILPQFETFTDYLRYRVQSEHPADRNLGIEDGFTDDFFNYAIEESELVFGRR